MDLVGSIRVTSDVAHALCTTDIQEVTMRDRGGWFRLLTIVFVGACSTTETAGVEVGRAEHAMDGDGELPDCGDGIPFPHESAPDSYICVYPYDDGEPGLPDPVPPPMDEDETLAARAACTPIVDCDDHLPGNPVPIVCKEHLPSLHMPETGPVALAPAPQVWYMSVFEKHRAPLIGVFGLVGQHSATRITRYSAVYDCVADKWRYAVDAGPTDHGNHGPGPGGPAMKRYSSENTAWGGVADPGFTAYNAVAGQYCPCNDIGSHTTSSDSCYAFAWGLVKLSPVTHPQAHVCHSDTRFQQQRWHQAIGQAVGVNTCGLGLMDINAP